MSAPIDREALWREAFSPEAGPVEVSRDWLARVYEELSALDELRATIGRVFGSRGRGL